MSHVRAQRIYDAGATLALEIVAGGKAFSITKAEIRAFYQSTSGNAASRRAQLITWFKNEVIAALGADQFALTDLDFEIDLLSGGVTVATIGRA